MAFTQIVEIDGVDQEQALRHLLTQWHDDQSGQAPGYLAARILADEDAPGRYLVEVDFASADEAKRNNDRAETQEWASKLRELAGGEPTYRNLRPVQSTST